MKNICDKPFLEAKASFEGLGKNDPWLRSLRIGGHHFPGVWSSLFPPALQKLRFPLERSASCHDCPKIASAAYRPDYRCCTYHPRIPNFLLGLAAQSEAGPLALDRLLELNMVLPEGMLASPRQWLDFMEDDEQDLYGRSEKVLCPLLEKSSGLCQIHAFRNAVCSTYFCSHEQAESGEEFWGQLQTLGSQVELGLAQWSLEEIGFDLEAYLERLDKLAPAVGQISAKFGWSASVLDELWGEWRGREKDLLSLTAAKLSEHRFELWDIAKSRPILEAQAFERALDALASGDIATNDSSDAEGDAELPEVTWKRCLEAYERLWTLQL